MIKIPASVRGESSLDDCLTERLHCRGPTRLVMPLAIAILIQVLSRVNCNLIIATVVYYIGT